MGTQGAGTNCFPAAPLFSRAGLDQVVRPQGEHSQQREVRVDSGPGSIVITPVVVPGSRKMEGNKPDNRLAPAEEEEPLAGESGLSQLGDPDEREV